MPLSVLKAARPRPTDANVVDNAVRILWGLVKHRAFDQPRWSPGFVSGELPFEQDSPVRNCEQANQDDGRKGNLLSLRGGTEDASFGGTADVNEKRGDDRGN